MFALHSKGGMLLTLTLLLASSINAQQYYDSYEPDAEFVPLEAQQQQSRNTQHHNEKPFDVDVVSTDVGQGTAVATATSGYTPGIYFQHAFPFFGNDFLSSFGGFGIGSHQQPWWKGANVCTVKEEDEKVNEGSSESTDDDDKHPFFGQFHFSVNSCLEKPNKYVCSRVVNKNGRKKTVTITRQCCHGYGRPRNAAYSTPCEKIDIKDIESTAADMGAREFVAKAKSSGLAEMIASRRNVTVFLPLDSAFTSYTNQLQSENNLVEGKSSGGMKELYLRHVVDGEVNLDDVHNEQILNTEVKGQNIRINSYQIPLSLSSEPYRYTANCVPIEKHDKQSEQGLIHTVAGVLPSASVNLMNIIRQRPDMSIMRTVLEKTKLSELLEGTKPITIFVPRDSAFDKLEPHLRRALKEGRGCASNILKNHILDLTFCSAASVAGAKTTAYNLLGEPMRFNRSKSEGAAPQPVIINGMAKITEPDVMGSNGVLHVIDTILPTDSALPLLSLMQQKNVTIFKRLVEAAGLDDKFVDMDNVTVFAPTDKALQATKWPQLLSEHPEQLRNNPELISFINYHVVQPMTKTCDLTEKLMPTLGGESVRVNLYSTHALFSNVMNRATVNCARLIHFDDESCGSVLHQVDKALSPPKMNLLQLLESNPNYSRFLALVRDAKLTNVLSNVEEGYTLLIPKNDVFDELEETLPKDPAELKNLVKTHIVNDVVCCAGIIPTNWPFVRSIEALNGNHLRITRDRRPKIENAGVTRCDTIASNGIVHEINDIIVPTSRRQQQPQRAQHSYTRHDDPFGDLFF